MIRDNVAIGRKSQAVGANFEAWVEQQHDKAKYYLGILAHVEHSEPHAKYLGGKLVYEKASVSDYFGTLEGGRSLASEAKSTSEKRFPLSEVTKKQQDHLESVARAGGLALLVVEFRSSGFRTRYAVPWLEVPWEVARTAKSVREEQLTKWRVIADDSKCYLSAFHPGGPRSSPHLDKQRTYARD